MADLDLGMAVEVAASVRFNRISAEEDHEPRTWFDLTNDEREAQRQDMRDSVEAAAKMIEAAVRAQIAEAIDALHTKLTEQWTDRVVDCDPEALHTLAGIDLAHRWIVRGDA